MADEKPADAGATAEAQPKEGDVAAATPAGDTAAADSAAPEPQGEASAAGAPADGAAPAEGDPNAVVPAAGGEEKKEEKKVEPQRIISYGYRYMEKGLVDLMVALKEADEKRLREIIWAVPIQDRCEFVNQSNEEGFTPVMLCTDIEQVDMLQDLLDYGADASGLDFKRSTPLHFACAKNNKKAIKLLVMYGGDIQIENNEYQKCHQMVKDQLAMQNYLNQCIDAQKDLLKEKRVIPCTRQQRSYLRSLYDIIDVRQIGRVRIDDVAPLLNVAFEGKLEGPDIRHVVEWFKNIDIDKRGVLSFQDFILACQTGLTPPGKGGGKKKGSKKKK